MDTSGLFPKLAGSDPLSEVAGYTAEMLVRLTGSAWVPLAFEPQWTDFGAPYQAARVKRVGNIVHMQGIVKRISGTGGGTIGTIPAEFRPAGLLTMAALASDGTTARLTVSNAGAVGVATAAAIGFVPITVSWML